MTCETSGKSGRDLLPLGATWLSGDQTAFLVWAPKCEQVEVEILGPKGQRAVMDRLGRGYFQAVLGGARPGSLYHYVLNSGKSHPDPASRFQPRGVDGPSQVTSLAAFPWTDADWSGIPLEQYIIYEIHLGTFTPAGTFDAVIAELDELRDLGITALELMPVAQFPGARDWGYDGVFPFAAQNSYGGPDGLARLVNACHQRGLAVVLDVVYNHLGPEGNVLGEFGDYFTDQYRTPWGQAVNFDGAGSDEVVRYFSENALYWLRDLHIDALRLDAIHGITDRNAQPFLQLLAGSVKEFGLATGRNVYLIAESDFNDARFLKPRERGGYGLDAQWNDDFHHALHALLTGERSGYYEDFGTLGDLATAFTQGYVYSGQYSRYRRCRHGNSSGELSARQFVVFAQNHDQVGNRLLADRLSRLVSFDELKLAAAVVILSPFIPLLFMGEEHGEEAPFNFFCSYQDPALIEAVRKGRKEEFAAFQWQGDLPDPQAESSFLASRVERRLSTTGRHRVLRDFYHELIQLRKAQRPLRTLSKSAMRVSMHAAEKVLVVRRWAEEEQITAVFSFSGSPSFCRLELPVGRWKKLLDSAEPRWAGPGSGIPETIESQGAVSVEIGAHGAFVLKRFA